MSNLKESLDSGKFTLTGEVGPPKGVALDPVLEEADLLRDRVDGINVTDLQAACMRVSSLSTCALLKQRNVEPIRSNTRFLIRSTMPSMPSFTADSKNLACPTGWFAVRISWT